MSRDRRLPGKRVIVGISGASGILYGVRLLQALRKLKVETHLVVTRAAEKVIRAEAEVKLETLKAIPRGDPVCLRRLSMEG